MSTLTLITDTGEITKQAEGEKKKPLQKCSLAV